jgi:hypothetical protein
MNLTQVIHQRWAAATALNAVLPAARVYTGMSADASLPRAAIIKRSDKPTSYASGDSAVDAVVLRFVVYQADYADAAEIIHQIKVAFDRSSFDLSGADRVQNMQRMNDFEEQLDDGTWQMTIDFTCTVYLASGA